MQPQRTQRRFCDLQSALRAKDADTASADYGQSPQRLRGFLQGFPPNAFLVGFTSVNWRKTWKYGERAFRYCQHDAGHAIGSARIAAQTLGWRMLLLNGLADDTVAALLGVDQPEDFEGVEREQPDCLAVVWSADQAADLATGKTILAPVRELTQHIWHGKANRLSRDDPVQWEYLNQVEVAPDHLAALWP